MNISTRTARRLIQAAQPGSWRDLSDVAVAELAERGLFDADLWNVTDAGRAALAELGYRANGSRVFADDADAELALQLLQNESRAAGRKAVSL